MSFTQQQLETQWAELSYIYQSQEIKIYSSPTSWDTITISGSMYKANSCRWMGNFIQVVFENGEVRNYTSSNGSYNVVKNGHY